MNIVKTHLHNLLSLIYPTLCYSCSSVEPLNGYRFCLSCLSKLPFIANANDAYAALAGKESFPEQINFFYSLFYYTKDSSVADMVHSIKYEGQYRIAHYLGELLGKELNKSKDWKDYSILPVPIHRRRFLERGYNQSEEIAKGISKVLGRPIITNVLLRKSYESSQTGKGRLLRTKVLNSSFALNNAVNIPQKVILIDDVVTTGSTINACYNAIKDSAAVEIDVATIGVSI